MKKKKKPKTNKLGKRKNNTLLLEQGLIIWMVFYKYTSVQHTINNISLTFKRVWIYELNISINITLTDIGKD